MISPTGLRVVLVDPGRQVPNYSQSLAEALAEAGAETRLVTSPLLHYAAQPPGAARIEEHFGRLLGREGSWLRSLARRAGPRRALRGLAYPFEMAAFVRAMKRECPNVIHFQWSLLPPVDGLAIAALRRAGLSVVYTVHNSLPHEPRPWHRRAFRGLYTRADRLILHTEASRARLHQFIGPTTVPADIVAMPADTVLPATDRKGARIRLDLPADAPTLLFFGHARPYKGLDLLLDAWPALQARRPEARLLIAGNTAGGEAGRAALAARIASAAPDGGIDWRPGYVPSAAVADFFAAADLVALPYRDSDHSAVLTAARGYGRAVVATAVGGLPEALAAGGGRLVAPEDPAAMAEALGNLLSDPAERRILEKEALAAAGAWTWADAAQAMLAVYTRAGVERQRSLALPFTGPLPFVSVVMPVRDEASHIESALRPLLASDYPADRLEILVVDGGSRDGTRAVVRELAESWTPGRLRLLDNPAGITPAGLNQGIAAARGDVILRMDGHARPAPDYLPASVDALRRTGAWVVGGAMIGHGETPVGRAVALAMGHPLGAGNARFRLGGEGPTDTVYLGAWPKALLEQLGGFDPGLIRNQDYELNLRVRAAGGQVWLDPGIRSTTLTRDDLPALARQYFGYGEGRAATLRRHPHSLRWRQALPALWVAGLVLGLPAAWLQAGLRLPLAAAILTYVLVLAMVSLQIGRSQASRDARWLPLVFACMHLSWGAGFWRGLIREARRPHDARTLQ